MLKKLSRKAKVIALSATLTVVSTVPSFADQTTPTSMLSDDAKNVILDFAADIVPTVIDLVAVLVPVGLTLWGIGFAVRKGINFLQKRANKAVS